MITNILEYLENTANRFPQKVAFADLQEEITFEELERQAKAIGMTIVKERLNNCSNSSFNSFGHDFHNYPVVVYMDKRAYNVSAFLGAVYAGAFYVPIDAKMPVERIQLIFQTLQPKYIICDDKTETAARGFGEEYQVWNIRELIRVDLDGQNEFTSHQTLTDNSADDSEGDKESDSLSCIREMKKATDPLSVIRETGKTSDLLSVIRETGKTTDLLYVLFTSGSTGVPKGVTLSHNALIDFTEWIVSKYELSEETTLCNQAPFYFDASVPDLYIPLKTGATVYIPPKTYYTFPKKVLQLVEKKKVNTLVWVPSALSTVVNARAFEVVVPSSVSLVIFCGEVLPCKHLNVWRSYIPGAKYVNMYGPTEATYACTYYDIDRDFKDEEKLPLGRACENSEIILLNEKNEITTDGEIGELCILGQCLANGYYGAREKTEAAFVQNPVNNKWNEMMYRTGDLAYRDEAGILYFAGRKDFQIKRQGHRIELGEIENAIIATEGIGNAACIYNEESKNIVAIYTGDVTAEALQESLRGKLQHYMIPEKFISLKSMPMNLNGKIDRTLLKETYKAE